MGSSHPERRPRRRRVRVMDHHLHGARSLEDQLAGEQPVRDTAQRIQVNPVIGVGDAEHYLRRHERRGAAGAALGAER